MKIDKFEEISLSTYLEKCVYYKGLFVSEEKRQGLIILEFPITFPKLLMVEFLK